MNILPKKRWHVRTKDNIERVRRDEEQAANEEKERQRRVALAEQEARTELLRSKSRKRGIEHVESSDAVASIPSTSGHVNFFAELEDGQKQAKGNKEYEEEKKAEKEKAEKSIGLLTYLGQSAIEAQTNKPWYLEKISRKKEEEPLAKYRKTDFEAKKKAALDPINDINKLVSLKTKLLGKHKYQVAKKDFHRPLSTATKPPPSKPAGPKSVEQLRAERLAREKAERARTEQLLAKMRGEKDPSEAPEPVADDRQRRYNSQFNPEFVRKPKKKRDYHE